MNSVHDIRDIPSVTMKRMRETMEKFRILGVTDYIPPGDRDGPEFSWKLISSAVMFRDNYSCRVCNISRITEINGTIKWNRVRLDIQVHHIVPRKDGGRSNFKNLITLCEECHRKTFSRDYGGIPLLENYSLDSMDSVVPTVVPQDLRGQLPTGIAYIPEVAIMQDDMTGSPFAVRDEKSAAKLPVSILRETEFRKMLFDLEAHRDASYMTLPSRYGRTGFIRVFLDRQGRIILS